MLEAFQHHSDSSCLKIFRCTLPLVQSKSVFAPCLISARATSGRRFPSAEYSGVDFHASSSSKGAPCFTSKSTAAGDLASCKSVLRPYSDRNSLRLPVADEFCRLPDSKAMDACNGSREILPPIGTSRPGKTPNSHGMINRPLKSGVFPVSPSYQPRPRFFRHSQQLAHRHGSC